MIHKNLFGALALTALTLTAPVAAKAAPQHNRPRIVVTMMVDQMTWDYLYRYQARFVEGGFKRLLTQGFNCENTRINYIPRLYRYRPQLRPHRQCPLDPRYRRE